MDWRWEKRKEPLSLERLALIFSAIFQTNSVWKQLPKFIHLKAFKDEETSRRPQRGILRIFLAILTPPIV